MITQADRIRHCALCLCRKCESMVVLRVDYVCFAQTLYIQRKDVGRKGRLPLESLLELFLGLFHLYKVKKPENNDNAFSSTSAFRSRDLPHTYNIFIIIFDLCASHNLISHGSCQTSRCFGCFNLLFLARFFRHIVSACDQH